MTNLITEQELLELKYSKSSIYYKWQLVDIFFAEYQKRGLSAQPVLECARCIYHRLVDVSNNIWEIRFADNSYCLFKICGNEYAKCFAETDFNNVNHFFPE